MEKKNPKHAHITNKTNNTNYSDHPNLNHIGFYFQQCSLLLIYLDVV